MFIPVPVLVLAGVIVVVLIALVLRRPQSRDPLMGNVPPFPPSSQVKRAATPQHAAAGSPLPALPPATRSRVAALLQRGRKIEAIKLAREELRVDLKTAKELVDEVEGSA